MTIPSTSAIATVDGRRRGSSWMAGHTLYPYPVYVAEFADNTVARLTFWQETGKDWNFKRARRLLAHIYGKPIARGFIEHDDPTTNWLRVPDPALTHGNVSYRAVQKPKRGPTAAQLKKLLANVLEGDPGAIEQARELLAA